MNIVFLGNFGDHNILHCTESDWSWTYKKMGHTVIQFQEREARTEGVVEACKDADLFHYVHTHSWETPGIYSVEGMLQKIKELGVPSVGVHLDYWRGLDREVDVGVHPWWRTDFTFTADGGSNDWYRSKGINHFYLKAGVVERFCHKGTFREEFNHDVIFAGSYQYHKEWSYRPKLIDWLTRTYGDRFQRYGGDTPYGAIRGEPLNDLYTSAKVVVGDSLCLNFNHPDYYSDRLFETIGRGGFIIFPYIKGIETCYELGKELITYEFDNADDLRGKIDYYLEHPEERERIKQAGFERTKNEHTFTHRAEEMFAILKKEGAL